MPGTTATSGARRVVVADDSRLMRRMLSDALGRQGFDVVGTAADGDEALDQCRAHRPDALTLDLHMPGLDGLGVLRALRDGKAEPVPVVVVSAFSPVHGAYAVDALGEPLETFTSELGRKVGEAAHASRVRRPAPPAAPRRPAPAAARVQPQTPALAARRARTGTLLLIASSTGGPRALGELVPRLPVRLGAGGL